jgi:hypothetical protein
MPEQTQTPPQTSQPDVSQDEKTLQGLKLDDPDTLRKIADRVYQLFLLEARIENERAGRSPGSGKR